MKTIRNLFGSLAIIGGLVASLNLAHAQTTTGLDVMAILDQARALAASEPVLEQSIPVVATGTTEDRPPGTYWSLTDDQPPMPFEPLCR